MLRRLFYISNIYHHAHSLLASTNLNRNKTKKFVSFTYWIINSEKKGEEIFHMKKGKGYFRYL